MFGEVGGGELLGREAGEQRDFGGREGLTPEPDFVEGAVAETRVAGARADLDRILAHRCFQRVPHHGRLGRTSVEVDAQAAGGRRAVIGDRQPDPLADGQLGLRLDGGGGVRPEMDGAPAQPTLGDEQFQARRIGVPGVESGGVQHRGPSVLFAEADVGREGERVEASELAEAVDEESAVAVERDAFPFGSGRRSHRTELVRAVPIEGRGFPVLDLVGRACVRQGLETVMGGGRRDGGRGRIRRRSDRGEGLFEGADLIQEPLFLGGIGGAEQAHEGRGDLAVIGKKPVLVDVAEHGGHREVILLRDRVVFMVVAAGAFHRQAHEAVTCGHDAVRDAVLAEFLRDRSAFEGHAVDPVVRRSHFLVQGRIGQQVAGQLLREEPVVGHVAVQGLEDPVAPRPGEHLLVARVTPGVGVTREVEPGHREVLAVAWGREHRVHPAFIGVGGFVREEGVDFLRGRREARQGEGGAAQKLGAFRGCGRTDASGLDASEHEAVQRVLGP